MGRIKRDRQIRGHKDAIAYWTRRLDDPATTDEDRALFQRCLQDSEDALTALYREELIRPEVTAEMVAYAKTLSDRRSGSEGYTQDE